MKELLTFDEVNLMLKDSIKNNAKKVSKEIKNNILKKSDKNYV